MASYLVRAGRSTDKERSREDYCLNNSVTSIGWSRIGSLLDAKSYQDVKKMVSAIYKGTDKEKAIPSYSSQLWTFYGKIKEGDYILMPMIAKAGHVAIGRVTGGYKYQPDDNINRHIMGVNWEKVVKRSVFGEDIIRGPLSSRGTICSFQKIDEADYRIKKIIEDGKDPYFDVGKDTDDEFIDGDEFAYENALREYISNNLEIVETGLNLFEDGKGNIGVEYPADSWNIDILAVDNHENFVIIELKKSLSGDKVFGQIARYMGWVKEHLAKKGQTVRGIIIGGTISNELKYAAMLSNNVKLMEYSLSVKLKRSLV